jgi:hypothetical protein
MSLRKEYLASKHPIHKVHEIADDYNIFRSFIGDHMEVGRLILSPMREDSNPTFSIFLPTKNKPQWPGQLLFKDFNGASGNVITFAKMMAESRSISLNTITEICDYIIGEITGVEVVTTPKLINVYEGNKYYYASLKKFRASHLDFWDLHGVKRSMLDTYRILPAQYLLNESEKIVKSFSHTTTFIYAIFDKFKIYQPYEENFKKFFNQCTAEYIQGLEQCTGLGDKLLVTKSLKDIVVYQSHANEWIDMIAPQGEGYKWDLKIIAWILDTYSEIIVVYDYDAAGIKGASLLEISLKTHSNYRGNSIKVKYVSTVQVNKRGKVQVVDKDIADFRLVRGEKQTVDKVKEILS